jgi:hypothetical protein
MNLLACNCNTNLKILCSQWTWKLLASKHLYVFFFLLFLTSVYEACVELASTSVCSVTKFPQHSLIVWPYVVNKCTHSRAECVCVTQLPCARHMLLFWSNYDVYVLLCRNFSKTSWFRLWCMYMASLNNYGHYTTHIFCSHIIKIFIGSYEYSSLRSVDNR